MRICGYGLEPESCITIGFRAGVVCVWRICGSEVSAGIRFSIFFLSSGSGDSALTV
jgi:hypothetical protein